MEMLKKLEEEDSVTDHGEHSGVSSLEERLEDLSLGKIILMSSAPPTTSKLVEVLKV